MSKVAEKNTSMFGFWVYLMTDCMVFATLFATYAVLNGSTNGAEGAKELFDLPFVLVETIILLLSSALSGVMLLAFKNKNRKLGGVLLGGVLILGAAFLAMELYEFSSLANEGLSWQRSAFLSSFFTLVGTHGLHILVGLIWGLTMFSVIIRRGLNEQIIHKIGMFTIFWHFLDVVWIFIFTFVYMSGGIS